MSALSFCYLYSFNNRAAFMPIICVIQSNGASENIINIEINVTSDCHYV